MTDDTVSLESLDQRLDELTNLFQRRLLDDKDRRRTFDELYAQLETAQRLAAGEAQMPLVRELFHLIDRLDGYDGCDTDFAASVAAEVLEALRRQGIEEIPTDGPPDPSWHEVVGDIPGESAPSGIAGVRRRGYTHNGRVLRPARVVVAERKPPA